MALVLGLVLWGFLADLHSDDVLDGAGFVLWAFAGLGGAFLWIG